MTHDLLGCNHDPSDGVRHAGDFVTLQCGATVLEGLWHLLFERGNSVKVGERDHLHRILKREL